jgi:peptide/nickel transport system substrate-binding protein
MRNTWKPLVALAVMALLVAGCGGTGNSTGPTGSAGSDSPKVVTIAFSGDFEMTDPYYTSTTEAYTAWPNVLDPLVVLGDDGKNFVGALAESWTATPEYWEFKLREGVKCSDGSAFTADDVAFSYDRIVNDPLSQQASQVSSDVKSVKAVDEHTVQIFTTSPKADLLTSLMQRSISCKAAFEKYGSGDPRGLVGTGPYTIKENLKGQRVVLTRNPLYWGEAPAPDEVILRSIAEPAARVTALQNGEVDVINNVPPELMPQLTGNVHAETVPSLLNFFLAMNPTASDASPLADVRVRQAISYAIDREALVKDVLKEQAVPVYGPIGPSFFSYDPDLEPAYRFDPEKAKALLVEAGYPNGFSIDQWTSSGQFVKDKEVSQAINGMLKNVGINANLKSTDFSTYFTSLNQGKYGLYLNERGNYPDPSGFFRQYFQTGNSKRINVFDSELDALLLKGDAEFDPAKREDALRAAQSKIMELAPAAFLYDVQDSYGVSNRIDFKPKAMSQYAWPHDITFR